MASFVILRLLMEFILSGGKFLKDVGFFTGFLQLVWLLVLLIAHKKNSKALLHCYMPGYLLIDGITLNLQLAGSLPWTDTLNELDTEDADYFMIFGFAINCLFIYTDFRSTIFINLPLTIVLVSI
jgi:predicted RND superfamily exporter protein